MQLKIYKTVKWTILRRKKNAKNGEKGISVHVFCFRKLILFRIVNLFYSDLIFIEKSRLYVA